MHATLENDADVSVLGCSAMAEDTASYKCMTEYLGSLI